MFDNLSYLAMMAFGFGLSLATYRLFAMRNSWPMGAFHADLPAVPIMIGLVSIVVGVLFAASVGDTRGWMIVGFGFLLWLVWLSLLRGRVAAVAVFGAARDRLAAAGMVGVVVWL